MTIKGPGRRVVVWESSGNDVFVCPRCGRPIKRIYARARGDRVYYYAYHGKNDECYLGPELYEYVTRTHSDLKLVLKGGVEPRRKIDYIVTLMESLDVSELSDEDAARLAKAFATFLGKWRAEKARRRRAK